MAWVLDSWLRNQQGDWEKKKKKKNQEFVPHPHAQKERQVMGTGTPHKGGRSLKSNKKEERVMLGR